MEEEKSMRTRLTEIALEWQNKYGIAPQITSALSEYDAAMLIGCSEEEYTRSLEGRTAVSKGFDFHYEGKRYQVKANRPSGKPGSKVTIVGKANNFDWDYLIWILYNTQYEIEEAWLWHVAEYKQRFENQKRLSPGDMRMGKQMKT